MANTTPINVGLNLQGNALGTVDQLTQRMISLRDTAKAVGDHLVTIDKNIKSLEGSNSKGVPTNKMQKILKQQTELMMTTPDMLAQRFYQKISKAQQASQINSLVNSPMKFQDARTMNTVLQQYDASIVRQALKTRLDLANSNGDIQKIKSAEKALVQYKNTLRQLNIEFKGFEFIRREQNASIQNMLNLPAGQAAMQRTIDARQQNQFYSGARESAVLSYMSDPSRLVPANRDYTSKKVGADQVRKDLEANASKITALHRLMGQNYLQEPSKNPQIAHELNQQSKLLTALEDEKIKLQSIQGLKRANVRLTDEQIQKQKGINENLKNTQVLEQHKVGNLKVNPLSTATIANLDYSDLMARKDAMQYRVNALKKVSFEAEKLGNAQAKKDADELIKKYIEEIRLLKERKKYLDNQGKPNSFVDRLNQMNTGESSGALLGMQGLLMRNYMLWGAFMGSITGSYAFLRDFEVALKQTQAISQATDTQMQGLKNSILEVGENSRFTAIEITEAATTLAQAGFSLAEIQKTLESVTLLATATGSSLKETVDIATSSLGAFQLSADNMPRIVNQITQAMNLSKLDIQKFQLAVQYAGNAASDAGLNFEELLASVSTVANAGVRSGSTLGTGFRQLLTDLIAPSAKFEKILSRLGLTTADIDVRTNGLVGSLKKLKEAGFTTADAYESFEVRSVAFYTALANNLDTYDNLSANLDNNTAAMEANEIQMNSLGAQTDRMFNQFKAFAEVSGGPLRESLTDLIRFVADLTTGVTALTNNAVVKNIVQFTVMTATLTTTIVVVRSMWQAIAGLVVILKAQKIAAVEAGVATAAAGAAMSRAVPIIAAISAGITLLVMLYKGFTKANETLKIAVEDSKTSLNNLKDTSTSLQGAITEVTNKLTSLESRFENIKDDPAALAVEMSNLRTKAMELGVTLETDLTGSIESVKKGWQELRIELGKELEMNLDRQVSELRNLSALTAQMRAEEARKNLPTSISGANKGGYGLIYDAYNLKNQIGLAPPAPVSMGLMFKFSTEEDFNRQATSLDVFNEVAKFNKGGVSGTDMNKMLENLHADLMTPQASDEVMRKAPEWLKTANLLLTNLNKARDGYLKAANNTKVALDARANARVSADSVTNLAKTVQDIQTYLNSISGPLLQAESMDNQARTQSYTNTLNKQLMDGTYEGRNKVNWGKALSVVDPTKAKVVSAENLKFLREDLMGFVNEAAAETGLPPEYIIAHMAQESGISKDKGLLGKNPDGSTTSAVGLMQVTKGAAQWVGANYSTISSSYRENILAGAKNLKKLMDLTDGTLYSASRAYYMGIGNWKKEQQKGTNKRTNEANNYTKGIFSTVYAVRKGTFGQVVIQQNPMSEGLTQNVTQLEQLKADYAFITAELKALPNEVDKRTEEEDKKYKDLVNYQSALSKAMSDVSSGINNELRSERAKQDQNRKIMLDTLALHNEETTNEIIDLESQIVDFYPEKGGNLKDYLSKQKELADKLKAAKLKQANIKVDIETVQSAEFANNSTSLVITPTLQAISKLKLDREIASLDKDFEQKRKEQLDKATKKFSAMIKEQNKQFVDDFKSKMQALDEPYQDALIINEFNDQQQTWQLEDELGITDMRNRRTAMDDPRFKNQFTDAERKDLDLAIQTQSSRVDEVRQINTIEKRDIILEQIKEVTKALEASEIKLKKFKLQQNLALDSNLSADELSLMRKAQQKEMDKVSRDIQKHKTDLLKLQETARNLDNELSAKAADNTADRYNMADTFKSISGEAVRMDKSAAGYERDIQTTIGGINSAFNNLINTAISASDNVDDFFKIITGGSSESREAFKAFGYDIISTIAKVVQNRMVNKFVDMMVGFIFGAAPTSSSAALSGQMMDQNASSANNGSQWWNVGLSALVQAGVGAFTGWYGGLGSGGVQSAGVQSSGATTQGLGAGWNDSGITSQSVINNQGGFIPRAEGGEVVGGIPNKDSVPIMSMPGEYYLPTKSTEVVGRSFLNKLKDDPNGVMDAIKGTNLGNRPQINKSVQSNIYMVAPSAVPSTIGANDIVVAVSDNIARNGELKQLIKQVNAE